MGLASALSTALTGLNAAETAIDVAGNNIANANTVGFKASSVSFATQFSQTQSLGSSPNGDSGGSNPAQSGLGVEVASTTADFSQGTIQNTSDPNDLAIQGDGFFIVQGGNGQQLYSRDGEFTTNANNQLVTSSGDLVLGESANSSFQISSTALGPLTIPLGSTSTAQATTSATLEGSLPPAASTAAPTTGSIIQSQSLTDGSVEVPTDLTSSDLTAVNAPDVAGATAAISGSSGSLTSGGTYEYEVTYSYTDNGVTNETPPSSPISIATTGANQAVTLSNLPQPPAGSDYTSINIYRTDASGTGAFSEVDSISPGTTSFTDTASDASLSSQPTLNTNGLAAGSYSYYVTYVDSATGEETRPTALVGPVTVSQDGGAVQISNLPTPTNPDFDEVVLYRNTSTDSSNYYEVGAVPAGTTSYIDDSPDASITSNQQVNLNGPAINSGTLLTDVVELNGSTYTNPFSVGTINFTGTLGSSTLTTQSFQVTSTTTVGQFEQFISQAFGIQASSDDPTAGFSISGAGQLQINGDGGADNALNITTSSLSETLANGSVQPINLNFSTTQAAAGNSASTNFVAYDSLGTAINVTVTAVVESTSSAGTTYRWYATSGNNQPSSGASTGVGTGTITFDGNGNLVGETNTTVSIDRSNGAVSPLAFNLDFSAVSGLSNSTTALSVSTQNGSAPGTLSSFAIGANGLITGTFSNGVTQTLGQVMLAKFSNDDGLVSQGNNLFAEGVNSGLPIVGTPGTQGIGTLVPGAVEESNTDVGTELVNLITDSTTYRGGAQVISTVQTLYDTLLNLRTS